MKHQLTTLTATALFLSGSFFSGCNSCDKATPTGQPTQIAQPQVRQAAKGLGKVKIQYDPTANPDYTPVREGIMSLKTFEALAEGINNDFVLPIDIVVRLGDKGGPAFYPDTKEIHFPYGFFFNMTTQYLEAYPDEDPSRAVLFAVKLGSFVLFHELGHAFANIYELPLTGNEETAVDNLAVIISLESQSNGLQMVMDAAQGFELSGGPETEEAAEASFQDEHALNPQRFYNVLCMAYGKNPDAISALISSLHSNRLSAFLDRRAHYCSFLYEKEFKAWTTLLGPHFRKQ